MTTFKQYCLLFRRNLKKILSLCGRRSLNMIFVKDVIFFHVECVLRFYVFKDDFYMLKGCFSPLPQWFS